MIKKIMLIFLPLVLLTGSGLCAMEWPLPDAEIVMNFGFNNKGKPSLGTVFEGEGDINLIDAGELIFSFSSDYESASRLPSPLGQWKAIDHGNGLLSIYSRCENKDGNNESKIDKGGRIASAGISGWSENKGLFFILYDRKERRWVNPSMVISPFADTVPPSITGIRLRNANGRLVENSQLRNLSQGRYSVEANVFDAISEESNVLLAPYRIICSVNGEEMSNLSLETISARDGVLMVNRSGFVPALNVYGPYPAYEAAEVQLNRGQVMLEIIAMDISGNSRSSLIRLIVE